MDFDASVGARVVNLLFFSVISLHRASLQALPPPQLFGYLNKRAQEEVFAAALNIDLPIDSVPEEDLAKAGRDVDPQELEDQVCFLSLPALASSHQHAFLFI